MVAVRPEWLFHVASVFQRCALIPIQQPVRDVLDGIRSAIAPPGSAIEQLILEGLILRATHAIKTVDTAAQVDGSGVPIEDRVIQFLNQRYADHLTYTVIGRELGCDPEYLEMRFRNKTGQTLHSYLRQVRVRKSLEAIQRGEKIEAAALQCGFRSKSGFIRACRAVTGTVPSRLRYDAKLV